MTARQTRMTRPIRYRPRREHLLACHYISFDDVGLISSWISLFYLSQEYATPAEVTISTPSFSRIKPHYAALVY
jgi:hypothetical protein